MVKITFDNLINSKKFQRLELKECLNCFLQTCSFFVLSSCYRISRNKFFWKLSLNFAQIIGCLEGVFICQNHSRYANFYHLTRPLLLHFSWWFIIYIHWEFKQFLWLSFIYTILFVNAIHIKFISQNQKIRIHIEN